MRPMLLALLCVGTLDSRGFAQEPPRIIREIGTRQLVELIEAIDEVSITKGRLTKIKVTHRDDTVVTCDVDGHTFIVGLKDNGKTVVVGMAGTFRTSTRATTNSFNLNSEQFQFRANYSDDGSVGLVGGIDISAGVTPDTVKEYVRRYVKTFPEFFKIVVLAKQ